MAAKTLFFTIPAAVIPTFLLLFYFYKNDRRPEPLKALLVTFAWGIVSTIGVFILAWPAMAFVRELSNPYLQGAMHAIALAAVPEETLKMAVIVFYSMKATAFDEPMDGLVYGITASLGFATLENILYVSHGGFYTAFVRAFTAIPAHAGLGIIMGYALRLYKEVSGEQSRKANEEDIEMITADLKSTWDSGGAPDSGRESTL